MEILATSGHVLRINAPEWFALPAFVKMINRDKRSIATFHDRGALPSEYSDVFLPFETFRAGIDAEGHDLWRGDGSDVFHSEDLMLIGEGIIRIARNAGVEHGVAWISNLP
jgi:hypothetical protein